MRTYDKKTVKHPQVKDFYRVVVTSDWHVGSKQHDDKGLEDCLNKALKHKIDFAIHAGDITDGSHVYHGHWHNLKTQDVNEQSEMAAAKVKAFGLPFYLIGGNHDYSFTLQNDARPAGIIAEKANNCVDMGDFQGDLNINGLVLRLIHGAGGNAYSLTYPAQRYLRNIAEGNLSEVPDVLAIGHYHTDLVFQIYDCAVIHPSNFQKPNDYMIRRGLRGRRGLYVFEFDIAKGHLREEKHWFIKAT